MKDFLRTMFGVRNKRTTPPPSPSPQLGAVIVRRDVKMTVTRQVTPELWDWLLLSGWRVIVMRKDRRSYVTLPENALDLLFASDAEKRAVIHARLLKSAAKPVEQSARRLVTH